ncbi:hypothetical protein MJO29_000864 [Puccinia striiformis f. sp. tritici]|nr:hypothetical protein MJO29_000864 [Puccinia striiformis f. sp. tritici]
MSQLSYNLLARENPPAGYYLATESWRIHWLGPEPADLPPQIIQCTGKFKPFFSKKGSANGYETQMASSALDQKLSMENPAITKKKSKTNAAARSYKLTQQAAQDVNTSKQPATVAGKFNTLNVISKRLMELHKPNTKYKTRLPVFLHPTKDNHCFPSTGAVFNIWAKAPLTATHLQPASIHPLNQTRQR